MKQALVWIVLAACSAPIWGSLLWELWDGTVRPRLIRRDIIDRAAAAILAEHGERAEEMALIAEHRAWWESDSFKQGSWRRIRKRIAELRRERATPSPSSGGARRGAASLEGSPQARVRPSFETPGFACASPGSSG